MSRHFIKYKNSRLSYCRLGAGAGNLICFHGYGENGEVFSFLEKNIGSSYTIYAIELPYHGETDWKEALPFSAMDLAQIIAQLIGENEKFTLLGYSLGGRVVLSLYEKNPLPVSRLVLIAPDGFNVNFWYWLTTQTRLGNRLFYFTMKNPGWFFAFLKLLNKLKLVNTSIYKFVQYYIGKKELRLALYNRWTCLRKLKPDLKKIKQLVLRHQTPVRLLYGRYDKIIRPDAGEKLSNRAAGNIDLRLLNGGHHLLQEKFVEEIAAAIGQ